MSILKKEELLFLTYFEENKQIFWSDNDDGFFVVTSLTILVLGMPGIVGA